MDARPRLDLNLLDHRIVPATLAAPSPLRTLTTGEAPSITDLRTTADISLRDTLGSSTSSPILPVDDIGSNTAILSNRLLAVGSPAGRSPLIRFFDRTSGAEVSRIVPYATNFTGGVNLAAGDVNGDGAADLIVSPGQGGGPHIRIIDGVTLLPSLDFFAYDPSFRGGATVAVANIDGGLASEIITGAGPGGGPHVKEFTGSGAEIRGTFAFDRSYTGGVNVAAGDVTGDGQPEIVAGAGSSGIGTRVRVLNAVDFSIKTELLAAASSVQGGVTVAVGDLLGVGTASVITGTADTGGPVIRAFAGINGTLQGSAPAFTATSSRGVSISTGNFDGSGRVSLIATPGSGDIRTLRVLQRGFAEIARYDVPNAFIEV